MTMPRRGLILAGLALALAPPAGGAWAQAKPKDHVITMANMSYGRLPADIKVGDTITWVNNDSVPHTATARDKSFDVRIAAGRKVKMTAQKAGSFAFYCIYHSMMRGSLTVAG